MQISKITLYNYRIYKGENQITFDEDPLRNIHIVSGFNGFGKTTFLTSLVWCLFGSQMQEVDEAYKKRIKEVGGYPKYLEDGLNRLAYLDLETDYYVEIKFTKIDIPGIITEELTIRRTFYSGDKSDTLQILLDGKPNELVQEVGYELFIQDFILPKEIAKFFFFDAEKITELAEIQNTDQKRQLARAYSEVLGIKKYVDLRTSLHDQRTKYRRLSANEEQEKLFLGLDEEIKTLENRKSDLESLNKLVDEEARGLKKEIKDIQESLIRSGNVLTLKEFKGLNDKKEDLLARAEQLKEVFKKNLDLAPFAIAGKLFMQLAKRVYNEKSNFKGNSSELLLKSIEDLKSKTSLVKDSISKQQLDLLLHSLFEIYDSSANGGNSNDTDNKIGLSEKSILIIEHIEEQLHHKYQEDIRWVTDEMKRNRYELNDVTTKLARAESKTNDSIINRQVDLLDQKQQRLQDVNKESGSIQNQLSALVNELNAKKKVQQENQKKVHLQEDLIEKDKIAKRLISELNQFIFKIQEQKRSTLEASIKENLTNLMHKTSFVKDVQITIENEIIDIELVNKAGNIINKETLSMGEKQLYATAILQALVTEASFDFPVFIDSPMQKLDATHAKNIITYFYPTVSKQVVLLPLLQKEMSEKEFDLLEPYVKSAHLIYHKPEESASTFIHIDNDQLFETINKLYINDHV
ncbi:MULTISPECIES: AAA family ATPase [Sphingobacterium]|uniref:AAA family ATPase n=1 Tax=Sphingobacterium TaxID=28453 RepID=UPI00257F847E|nr:MULTISPECIES: AAA family ATPase [Sphingobacterium]